MIYTKTPFRMSFLGGGTDYQPFFGQHGGSVISTTFDKYSYVSVRHLPRFFEYRNQLTYSRIERTASIDEIEHPMVRNAMKMLGMDELFIGYDADLPARSGLGSSSSFAVGLLHAFHALKGHYAGKDQLAREAIYLERELCEESGGWQDQIAVAYGGLNRINFYGDDFDVKPIIITNQRKELLNQNIMMFFTGFSRLSSEIAAEQVKATRDKTSELLEMMRLVDEGEKILSDRHGDLDDFGRLLNESWQLKRGLTRRVSTDTLDQIYRTAILNGALGGKLLGAGGGGFFIFYTPADRQETVKDALKALLFVPFRFEDSGTEILYYRPEDYVPEQSKKENFYEESIDYRNDRYGRVAFG